MLGKKGVQPDHKVLGALHGHHHAPDNNPVQSWAVRIFRPRGLERYDYVPVQNKEPCRLGSK